ncbi:MAG: outer membrane lipid asymmetry maintenance protein MlaD [Nitrospirota bacterium]
MRKDRLEILVGVFVLVGLIALAFLSIKLGKLEVIGNAGYDIQAEFSNIGGLKTGAEVEIAGVEVGRVTNISLKDYQALVRMRMKPGVKISDDSVASIKTKGLIGEKYVSVSPGGSSKMLVAGATLRDTESAIDFESLIANYIFGKV